MFEINNDIDICLTFIIMIGFHYIGWFSYNRLNIQLTIMEDKSLLYWDGLDNITVNVGRGRPIYESESILCLLNKKFPLSMNIGR
jgi:hypothetical protein